MSFQSIKRSVAALSAALVLSTVLVGAAVGPVQAATSVVRAPLDA